MLAQSEEALAQCSHGVRRKEHLIKLGDLGRGPVPHANTVSINFLHKTEENREEAAVKVGEDRYCEQDTVRLGSGLTHERVWS